MPKILLSLDKGFNDYITYKAKEFRTTKSDYLRTCIMIELMEDVSAVKMQMRPLIDKSDQKKLKELTRKLVMLEKFQQVEDEKH